MDRVPRLDTRGATARGATALVAAAAIGLLAAGCATAPERSPEQVLEDATITSRVKTGLLRDPMVAGSAIGVEVLDGVVTLEGRVPSDTVATRAVEIARSTEGVRRVDDRLVRGGGAASPPQGGRPPGPGSSSGAPAVQGGGGLP